jgi:dCTP diphosphatase
MQDLQNKLREFAARREWEQFHTPKNLVMALAGEVGELIEIFQWLTPKEAIGIMSDDSRAGHVAEELADVFGYLLRLADELEVDLAQALNHKIEMNELKYPADKARGRSTKYTDL